MNASPSDPAGGAAELAEQALLGALLWEPARVADIADWLAADDFYRPAHAAIYRTITGLRTSMQRREPRSRTVPDHNTVLDHRMVLESLAGGEFHDLPVPRDGAGALRAAHLHTLMAMTPAADPRHRTEHVLYARLVLETSIRRQVAQLGARINQWVPVIAAPRIDTTDAAAALQRTLAELTHRMNTLAARAPAAAIPAPPTTTWGSETVPSAGFGTGGDVQAHEQVLIGACLSVISVRTEALARLVAADFASPGAAATWTAIATLAEGGGPIDFVLVAAELERTATTNGPGLPAQALLRLAGDNHSPVSGYRALQAVTRCALVRIAGHAAALLDQLGDDRTRALPQVVAAARDALASAAAATRRAAGAEPQILHGSGAAAATAARALTPPNGRAADRPTGSAVAARPDAPGVIAAVRSPTPDSRRAR